MKRLKGIIFPTLTFIVALFVAASIYLIFKSNYYLTVYVDGISMQPTLNANYESGVSDGTYSYQENVEFGEVDQSKKAINSIERFDIVTTYYPWDNKDYEQPYAKKSKHLKNADYKIKRVIALPGETFKMENNDLYIGYRDEESGYNWEKIEIKFDRNLDENKNIESTTLGNDEYWVMGDNYGHSNDSSNHNGGEQAPIYKENITGVLVSIKGNCTVKTKLSNNKVSIVNKKYYSKEKIYF